MATATRVIQSDIVVRSDISANVVRNYAFSVADPTLWNKLLVDIRKVS